MKPNKSILMLLSVLTLLPIIASGASEFATGGTGGNYLVGTLWSPPKASDGRIYREDLAALPFNTFVRVEGSKLKTNIDSAYAAAGRPSVCGVQGTFDYSGMTWDNLGKRGFAFGGGHATTGSNGVHQLDVTKGKWVPAVYESAPGHNGYTQNDADFLMNSTNQSYSKGLFSVTSGDLSSLHDSGVVKVKPFRTQSPQLYVRPFTRSSTGFAVKILGNPWGTAFVEAPGPEGFVSTQDGYNAIFPDTNNARAQIKTRWPGLWDGPMCSWHAYYFQAYLPKNNMYFVSAYGSNYWAHLDGKGWASETDSQFAPFNTYLSINSWGGLSASRTIYDSINDKLWFGSHVGNSANYWYTDAARLTAMGLGGKYWFWSDYILSYDLKTKTWAHKPLKANTYHTYWTAGNRFGDMGYEGNRPGHGFDMSTQKDSLMDFGDTADARNAHHVTNEGFGAAYFENQSGKMWGFAGGNTALVTEYSLDNGIPGAGRNGSLKIPSVNITEKLVNIAEVISNATVGVYNRIQYFPAESLLVVCSSTQKEIYFCRVNSAALNATATEKPVSTKTTFLATSPNPATTGSTATFYLPHEQKVELNIFDASGRLVSALKNGTLKSGTHMATWNTLDKNGTPAATGIYFFKLRTVNHVIMQKIVLVR